jgi:hypothetical protein
MHMRGQRGVIHQQVQPVSSSSEAGPPTRPKTHGAGGASAAPSNVPIDATDLLEATAPPLLHSLEDSGDVCLGRLLPTSPKVSAESSASFIQQVSSRSWLQPGCPAASPFMHAACADPTPEEQLIITVSQAESADITLRTWPQTDLLAAPASTGAMSGPNALGLGGGQPGGMSGPNTLGGGRRRRRSGQQLSMHPISCASGVGVADPDSGDIADDEADDASTALLIGGESLLIESSRVPEMLHRRLSAVLTGSSRLTAPSRTSTWASDDRELPGMKVEASATLSGSLSLALRDLARGGSSTGDISGLMHAHTLNSREGEALACKLPDLKADEEELTALSTCSDASLMSETLLAPGMLSSDMLSEHLAAPAQRKNITAAGAQAAVYVSGIVGGSHQTIGSSSGVTSMLMSERGELAAKCNVRKPRGALKQPQSGATDTLSYVPMSAGSSKPRVRFRVDGDIGVMTCVRLLFAATDNAQSVVGEEAFALLEKHGVL